MYNKLLCMFAYKKSLNLSIDYIKSYFNLNNNIFIYENVDNTNQVFCTFSVEGRYDLISTIIIIHRKTETNTFYTINAINQIIKNVNNGQLIQNYPIDWTLYKNQLLLSKNNDLEYINLELLDRIKL